MKGGDVIALMRSLDAEYRARAGLKGRRFYSIFYSRIDPSPVMILGINPGGNPASWLVEPGWDEFCANWQHDYVDFTYPIQAAMLPLLMDALIVNRDLVRRIPKTNMIFRRSTGVSDFRKQQGINLNQAAMEAEPTLRQIVKHVSPKAIIFEGNDAFGRFVGSFCNSGRGHCIEKPVKSPNGRWPATVFSAYSIQTEFRSDPTLAIVLGHPSKYANRAEFASVPDRMRERLKEAADELRELGPPPVVI